MSYCREEGKDQVIFATKDDMAEPSTAIINIQEEEDEQPGLILPNGDINWECPCLGGMATGPCGVPFREAFSCFHYSEAEPKGSDCYEAFLTMQECMSGYPELYPSSKANAEESAELGEISAVSDAASMSVGASLGAGDASSTEAFSSAKAET